MIATLAEIQKFLNDFHQKVEVFDIFFMDDREKNAGAIKDLGIIRGMRKEVVQSLTIEDYSEGPIKNILNAWGDTYGSLERMSTGARCISKLVTVYLTTARYVSHST